MGAGGCIAVDVSGDESRVLVPGNESRVLVPGNELPVLVPGNELPVLVAFGRSSSERIVAALRAVFDWWGWVAALRASFCPGQ